jgi:DNA-binding beta-propeller fold protein YncE
MNLVSERRDRRRYAAVSIVALALIALMALAQRAQAAENIYWDNYDANSVSFADINGAGGGALSLAGVTLENPEGMAYDSVTNRLFVASSGDSNNGAIIYINLDGSGAGVFSAPGAPVEVPEGIAVNPANRTLYWVNGKEGANTIGWARLDGSAGGTLNTAGTTVEAPYKLAVDPVNGKVYWANTKNSPFTIAFANADNSGGGGTLNLSGATAPNTLRGIAVDPAGGRVYWLTANEERISYASLGGGNGGDINLADSEFFDGPYGLAFDPSISRLYWANYSHGTERTNALGFTGLTGGAGGISPTTAPVDGPQDPIIIKSPTGTGAPAITRDAKNRALLNCPTGSWGEDYAGSFVYQAPRTFTYQWTRNGAAIPAATAATLTATKPGSYTCTVTATNQVGSAAQNSAPVKVKAAKVKLTTKKKAKADAGDLVTFKVKAVNQGDLKPKNAKLCVKLPKAAKDDLKAPKCKKLGLKGRAKKTLTLKVKVKPAADQGTDKLTFQVKGSAGKAAKSKILVK